eukprot:TRINITY_DN15740_c0_g1_i1.p1 TRINITY_DN15740_c0_g1~~TRINITY_DN15740_c0_g1_i1.p1  ORF type:complete len:184 (-),score=81.61 TRINITY_DN15740_c0_g1_i1:102-653(-)
MFGMGPPPPLYKRMFNKYDVDGNGSIGTDEFKNLAYELGYFLDDDDLALSLKLIDEDGSGEIELEEFANWWKSEDRFGQLQLSDEERETLCAAAQVFKTHDEDGSGNIDRDEFNSLHQDLVIKGFTDKDIDTCFMDLDPNNDGLISFKEYVEWLNRMGSLKKAIKPTFKNELMAAIALRNRNK